ncbi:MAG: Mur ligase [Rhodothermaceae bacterium]|nr:Mur ligase [Rhodothermaceae bacterium]
MPLTDVLALDDSRRLTGASLLLDAPGAVMEVHLPEARAEDALAAWERHLRALLDALGWADATLASRRYPEGASLAFTAPLDALYAATEVNEAAWAMTVAELGEEPLPELQAEVERLRGLIEEEHNPTLLELADAAAARGVTFLWDDDDVSVGQGTGVKTWPVDDIYPPDAIAWADVHDVPVALVTGTNGKSTTARLLGAILRADGRTPGVTSTDRIIVGHDILDTGDYSGPGGARTVLRDPRVETAVLEVARGGLLRRGLGTPTATAVAVTNVADDHLGDYGIETVEGLARVKFVVTKALGEGGVLVANAEDPYVQHQAHRLRPILEAQGATICWTALDPDDERVALHHERGGAVCAVVDGHLAYGHRSEWTRVIAVNDIPITLGGAARYNIRNALIALGLARALGVSDAAIAKGLAAFRSDPDTNPGRGNVFEVGEARVWMDFAHNEHGLSALSEAVLALPSRRRLVLLGHAGDRTDAEISGLARSAAKFEADKFILAEYPEHLRGRELGDIPRLLRKTLRAEGVPDDAIEVAPGPLEGTKQALDWAEPGDLLLLLVLSKRDEATALVREAAAGARHA